MRYLSVVVLAMLGLVLCGQRHRSAKVTAKNMNSDVALDIFYNRALKHDPLSPGAKPDPKVVSDLNDSQIGNVYKTINPMRSVLMYDCDHASKWCDDAAFGFKQMFAIAAKFVNPEHPADAETLSQDWYASLSQLDCGLPPESQFSSLDNAPFQLLAVANRMDMASPGDPSSGAEVHFAYGLRPAPNDDPQDLTVIVEFVLQPLPANDFMALANQWIRLSTDSPDQPAAALRKILCDTKVTLCSSDASKIQSINIRTNRDLSGATWRLTQFRLSKGSPAFVPAPLDDQINAKAQDPTSMNFQTIWNNASSLVGQGYAIPSDQGWLEASKLVYSQTDPTIGTPSGVCNPDINVRNMLGLQECSGCHTTESGSSFKQLANRLSGQSRAQPSTFLIGTGALRPSLVDLYYPNMDIVSLATIPYTTFVGPQCTISSPKTVERRFHDVARRTLFLAAASLGLGPIHNGRRALDGLSTHSIE